MATAGSGKNIEQMLPGVKQFGLNSAVAADIDGVTIDTSGNTAVPGTFGVTGVATFTAAPVFSAGTTPNVVSGSGATVTLTAAQSGSVVLMDRAAGIVFTLPSPTAGLFYDFYVSVSVTTNSYKVITNTGTVLLTGTLMGVDTDTSNAVAAWTGNGSSHIAVTQAAASTNSTGGLQGTYMRIRCLTSTLWAVEGFLLQAGTAATPFATS